MPSLDHLRLYHNMTTDHYPPHWHVQPEIIMPLENIYTVECCGRLFELREGDILILSSCCLHKLYAPKSGSRIIFQPDLAVLHNIRAIETIQTLLAPVTLVTSELYPSLHPCIHRLMLEIKEEYFRNTPLSEAMIYGRLIDLFVMIGRYHTETALPSLPASPGLREYSGKFIDICDYISAHCAEDLTLDGVARLAGFSKYHFTRLFRQFTGISFYKYVNRKRIGMAERLLADPEYTVTDVALQSGFTSMSSFIRMFKLVNSCTPTEFRQMHNQYHPVK